MNLTFVFWVSALYTLFLLGLQIYELLTGHRLFNFPAMNALYLALLSTYVGSKEVVRWSKEAPPPSPLAPSSPPSFRLPGEVFVGLWLVFPLVATSLVQFWPQQFNYPKGLNTIAMEVLGFYLGTSVSRWLKVRDTETHEALESDLAPEDAPTSAPPSPAKAGRISKKRQRYEEKIMNAVRQEGGIDRERVEKITGLKTSAAGRLLTDMVEQGKLQRAGKVGDTEARYQVAPES